ncbi:MAG TPA: hypothetical protein VNI78_05430 [Vicinamibacterales bacterium]|nr:hypothetical protein [Vicinamibacterales bacterium]
MPLAGIVTGRLVAPGAMSPVSMLPSFNRTRWTIVSAFRNTTVRPPASAGFGANDRAPSRRVMVMVTAPLLSAGEGDVGEPPPPPQAAHRAAPSTTRRTTETATAFLLSRYSPAGSKSGTGRIQPDIGAARAGAITTHVTGYASCLRRRACYDPAA